MADQRTSLFFQMDSETHEDPSSVDEQPPAKKAKHGEGKAVRDCRSESVGGWGGGQLKGHTLTQQHGGSTGWDIFLVVLAMVIGCKG